MVNAARLVCSSEGSVHGQPHNKDCHAIHTWLNVGVSIGASDYTRANQRRPTAPGPHFVINPALETWRMMGPFVIEIPRDPNSRNPFSHLLRHRPSPRHHHTSLTLTSDRRLLEPGHTQPPSVRRYRCSTRVRASALRRTIASSRLCAASAQSAEHYCIVCSRAFPVATVSRLQRGYITGTSLS
jgi:hypothetical protein